VIEYTVFVHDDGTKYWYDVDGLRHRLDGPAMEYADGSKCWYYKDKLHRLDGPAVEHPSGTKRWYVDGLRHRLGGPAVEYGDGDKYWYYKDKLHRLDGPAVEYKNGSKVWYLNNRCLSEAEWRAKTQPSCEGRVVLIDGKRYKLTEV